MWGYTALSWEAAVGAPPVQVVTGSIVIVDAAASSPPPQPTSLTPGLTTSQQLGLGLGVGLSLALIVVAALGLACGPAVLRATRAATQLVVVDCRSMPREGGRAPCKTSSYALEPRGGGCGLLLSSCSPIRPSCAVPPRAHTQLRLPRGTRGTFFQSFSPEVPRLYRVRMSSAAGSGSAAAKAA